MRKAGGLIWRSQPTRRLKGLRAILTIFSPRFLSLACAAAISLAPAPGVAKDQRTLIDSKESLYNQIYIYKEDNLLLMTFGFNKALYIESAFNPKDEFELPAPYTRYMTAGLAYAHKVSSVLEIGFGGGRTAWYLHRALPDLSVTSVELDPTVVDLSRKYFGIKDEPKFTVANEDGRQFLAHTNEHYDVILLDAFHGPSVPFHLLTKEFYALVAQRLNEGGVVLQNQDPDNALFDSVVKTMATALPNMDVYLADGNAVIAAYQGPRKTKEELAKSADSRQIQFKLRYSLPSLVAEARRLDGGGPAIDPKAKIFTDDFAPAEALKAIEKHNRQWPSPSDQP
jgi:spermidine synthase